MGVHRNARPRAVGTGKRRYGLRPSGGQKEPSLVFLREGSCSVGHAPPPFPRRVSQRRAEVGILAWIGRLCRSSLQLRDSAGLPPKRSPASPWWLSHPGEEPPQPVSRLCWQYSRRRSKRQACSITMSTPTGAVPVRSASVVSVLSAAIASRPLHPVLRPRPGLTAGPPNRARSCAFWPTRIYTGCIARLLAQRSTSPPLPPSPHATAFPVQNTNAERGMEVLGGTGRQSRPVPPKASTPSPLGDDKWTRPHRNDSPWVPLSPPPRGHGDGEISHVRQERSFAPFGRSG